MSFLKWVSFRYVTEFDDVIELVIVWAIMIVGLIIPGIVISMEVIKAIR